jgi:hypothetical protein
MANGLCHILSTIPLEERLVPEERCINNFLDCVHIDYLINMQSSQTQSSFLLAK